jgi:hypothetical protein
VVSPIAGNGVPIGMVLPVTAALRRRNSSGSMPSFSHSMSIACSMANGRLDADGRAIGLGARLVGDDVVALQVEVRALIERGRGLHHQRGAETRQSAGIEVDMSPR